MMTELDYHFIVVQEMLKTVKWLPCGEWGFIFEYYHPYGDLYVIHDKNLDCYHFMKAECPKEAVEQVFQKHIDACKFVVDEEGDEEDDE